MEFTLIASKLDKLETRINRLANKAEKFGLPPISLTIVSCSTETKRVNGVDISYPIVTVEISGVDVAPTINGWSFLATIEHTPAGNIVRSFSDTDISETYRTADATCEHCNQNRQRNNTYVLMNENGDTKQVGSTCLVDFIGNTDAEKIASFYAGISIEAILDELNSNEEEYDNYGSTSSFSIVQFVASVLLAVEELGFYAGSDSDNPTKHTAMSILVDGTDISSKMDEAREVIEAIKNYISSKHRINDYLHNINIILSGDYMEYRHIGFVASTYVLVKKLSEQKIEEGLPENVSTHVGVVGEKLQNVPVTFVAQHGFETQWGYSSFLKFADSDGNILVWKTSSDPTVDGKFIEEGCEYVLIVATIKAHDEFNDKAQTNILRCKLASE